MSEWAGNFRDAYAKYEEAALGGDPLAGLAAATVSNLCEVIYGQLSALNSIEFAPPAEELDLVVQTRADLKDCGESDPDDAVAFRVAADEVEGDLDAWAPYGVPAG